MSFHILTPESLEASLDASIRYQLSEGQKNEHPDTIKVLCIEPTEETPLDWLNSSSPFRLDLQFRNVHLTLQNQSAVVIAPEAMKTDALNAIAGFYVLLHTIERIEEQCRHFQHLLKTGTQALSKGDDIPMLKQAIAESTKTGLQFLAVKRRLELPSGTGPASLSDKWRTELATQALLFDRVSRVEHELEWLHEGLLELLDSKKETRRFHLESMIGLVIILILIIEFTYSYLND